MKKLTKIKLVNWHYIYNQTIDVKNHCLITGQNATGKSTILDAIQYILTAGEQDFNLAAHDAGGNRSLRSYIRCKTGIKNREYLREGDVTSHIALEFFDEETQEYCVIGTVIDYKEDTDSVKSIFYTTERQMYEEMFIEDDIILSINTFKRNRITPSIYQTKREAKTAFRILLGNLSERFFTLIPKALAFKPISNVKDFIYNYLLEEKRIDVQNIQDSIRSYKDLESTLKLIKVKIAELEDIEKKNDLLEIEMDKSTLLDLLLLLTSIDNNQQKVAKAEVDLAKIEVDKKDQLHKIKDLNDTIDIYEEKSRLLYSNLMSKDVFKNKEELERQIKRLISDMRITEARVMQYNKHVSIIDSAVANFKIDCDERKIYRAFKNIELRNVNSENIDDVRNKLIIANTALEQRLDVLYREQGVLNNSKQEVGLKYEYIVRTIRNLESCKLRYNPNVVNLKNEINSRIRKMTDMDVSVNVLAELLEVSDETWQGAIENYLNMQRFNLIIDPRFYDFALGVFDEIKSKMPVYGVGLVNTKRLDESFNRCESRSIASIITSNNVYAKRYINMIAGNVMMCDSVYDLEKYRVALTRESMVYSNFTVRQLNDNIEKPFIGRNAASMQLKKFQLDEKKCHDEYADIDQKIKRNDEEIALINELGVKNLIEELAYNITHQNQKLMHKDLVNKRNATVTGNLDDLQTEYENVINELKSLTDTRVDLYEMNGRIGEKIETVQNTIRDLQQVIIHDQETFANLKNNNIHLEAQVYEEYRNDSKRYKNTKELFDFYSKSVEKNRDNIVVLEDDLKTAQLKYNQNHDFLSTIGHVFMDKYTQELDKLIRSNLVEYEDKVRRAREDTERLFKEDFIAKLRNYIRQAQDGVRRINQALKLIRFGDDQYEFIFPKSKIYGAIYDMVVGGEEEFNGPIMTTDFEEQYNKELDELFNNLSVDEINAEGVINKYTDYRTYMDYDIKITDTRGQVTLFSDVGRAGSGGETQVPFYVSIIASFVQMYSVSKSTIGVILFDEAFDKMDSSRIRKMMEFINELDLQLIVAATPQKMESITQYVDTTLILLRQEEQTFVSSKIRKRIIPTVDFVGA